MAAVGPPQPQAAAADSSGNNAERAVGIFDQYKQQSVLGADESAIGTSKPMAAPGTRGATSRLPRRAKPTTVDDIEHHLYYGWKAHDLLRDVLIPEARQLIESRGPIGRARDVFRRLASSFGSLRDAVDAVARQLATLEPDTYFELRERADVLVAAHEALAPDVERLLSRRPPSGAGAPVPADDPFGLHLSPAAPAGGDHGAGDQHAWATELDKRDAEERATAEPQPVSHDQEQCSAEAPASSDAVSGIHLFAVMKNQLGARWGSVVSSELVGPGVVGPYRLKASLGDGGRVSFYLAFHRERQWPEWVIGPDSVAEFTVNIDHYVGAARASLPGSPRLPDSMRDGADRRFADPSMLELEAKGQAPYQHDANVPEVADDDLGSSVGAAPDEGHGIFGTLLAAMREGSDQANGGSAAVGAWNSHVRLAEYVEPAKRIARQLLADVKAGKVPHLEARSAAVAGRNQRMQKVRGRLSPAGRYASQRIKSDGGVSESEMVARKVPDILRATEPGGAGMGVLGEPGDERALMTFLGAESPEWAKYQSAMEDGVPRAAVVAKATQEMSEQPSVSRAIINSAGKSNKWVTRVAKLGRAAGAATAVLGIADAVETINDADASQRLHVAAQEGGGFVGGIIGAELGSMAAVWLASVIISGPAAPVVLVVSIIGGMIGAAVGASAGRKAADAIPELAVEGLNAVVTPGSAQSGGYPGLFERSTRRGLAQKDVRERLRQAMVDLDGEVARIDGAIAKVVDRNALDDLHAERFQTLSRRDHLGQVYALLRTGRISDADAWKAVGGEVIEPTAPDAAVESAPSDRLGATTSSTSVSEAEAPP